MATRLRLQTARLAHDELGCAARTWDALLRSGAFAVSERCLTRCAMELYIEPDWLYIQVTSMQDLTPRQRQILQLVQRAIHETGMPPTRAEIAKALKFRSVNAAEDHLRALERKGVIELLPGVSRGIRLKD